MSCGCILALNGYDVTVLEQDIQAGGCLQCFRRGDAVFETGMHYIGSALPGQTLHTLWNYLGIADQVKLSQLDPVAFDRVSLHGEHYAFANGRQGFVESLSQHFPKSRDELTRYYDLYKSVASSSPLHSLNDKVDSTLFSEYQRRASSDVIDSLIADPLLREVLVSLLPLYAGEKGRTPFTIHSLITDFYDQSAFRVVGGSDVVAKALIKRITDMGGKVVTRQKVGKIECNDQRATAVVTSTSRFPADIVVSSLHPAATMQLTDSSLIRPVYRKRMETLRNTTSVFTVYLKFKRGAVRYMNSNLYIYRSKSVWGCENYDEQSWPKMLLYMHSCHATGASDGLCSATNVPSAPSYAETGQIITYMSFGEVAQWEGTRPMHRGTDYDDFKKRKAETLIRALEEEVPGISSCIETYYTSTPLTYLDYTGTPQGSIYGVARDANDFSAGDISPRTRIPNLFLTGQSVTCHGMLGVLAGTLMTCSEVITRQELFRQLGQANSAL